jgi:hypothetical protein
VCVLGISKPTSRCYLDNISNLNPSCHFIVQDT